MVRRIVAGVGLVGGVVGNGYSELTGFGFVVIVLCDI